MGIVLALKVSMNKLKTEDNVRQLIEDYGYEDVVIFSNPSYASAFIVVSEDNRAVYSYNEMVKSLCKNDKMNELDAIEFIEFNTLRALPYYKNSPIILHEITN